MDNWIKVTDHLPYGNKPETVSFSNGYCLTAMESKEYLVVVERYNDLCNKPYDLFYITTAFFSFNTNEFYAYAVKHSNITHWSEMPSLPIECQGKVIK